MSYIVNRQVSVKGKKKHSDGSLRFKYEPVEVFNTLQEARDFVTGDLSLSIDLTSESIKQEYSPGLK